MTPEVQASPADFAPVFDRAADVYDQLGVEYFGPAGLDLVRLAGIREGHHTLDVGCGRGASLFPAARAVGSIGKATGIDLAPKMIAHLLDDIAASDLSPRLQAQVADAQDLPFADRSFDVVIAGFVLFFLPNPQRALREFRRVLRPGGTLAFTSTSSQQPERHTEIKAAVNDALSHYVPLRSEKHPTATLESLAATVGFTNLRTHDATYPAVFRDPEHYWQYMWSHGARSHLERISTEDLPRARSAVTAALEPFTEPDGSLRYENPARFAALTSTLEPTVHTGRG